ncbi:DUF1240 domain-containing protein [Serratia sp. L9]|uniref:DUF1240 domain-containing protein n=1 Tax=Serratia sp. L9 TaxID=3423946 RepID=UPI003D674EEC
MLMKSHLVSYSAITDKQAKMNNKLASSLAILAIIGTIISLFTSIYIDNKLKGNGYDVCQRTSWMAPDKFVKEISLCS